MTGNSSNINAISLVIWYNILIQCTMDLYLLYSVLFTNKGKRLQYLV